MRRTTKVPRGWRRLTAALALCGATANLAHAQPGGLLPIHDPEPARPVYERGDILPQHTPPEYDPDYTVYRLDLAGPRLGVTFLPDGKARSLFGWHFENQVTPSRNGPAFIVEKVFLLGGLEDDRAIPSASLIFGVRTPTSFEFGVGPNVVLGPGGFRSAIVLAAGQSFRAGGIRVPVNLAVALDKDGQSRVSLVTGWAIRDQNTRHEAPPRRQPDHSRPGSDL